MILHILFTLLKIIGILILVILGILLLAVLTVLFVPVRYEGEVGVKNSVSSIRARGTVTWFFRLIRGRFQYKNGKLHYELRICLLYTSVLAFLAAIQNKVKINLTKKGKDASKIQSGCGSDCATSVSYTHLDVYKRQLQNCKHQIPSPVTGIR